MCHSTRPGFLAVVVAVGMLGLSAGETYAQLQDQTQIRPTNDSSQPIRAGPPVGRASQPV